MSGPALAFAAGVRGRCPHCGKGALFEGFLKTAPKCSVCGFDLKAADSGDGPAVFIILIVGFIVCFGMLVSEIAWRPSPLVTLTVWPLVAAVLSLALLRPLKGLMLAAQFVNRASEAGSDDLGGRP